MSNNILTREQVEEAVEKMLEKYPEILMKSQIMDILQVSRPSLEKILSSGEIPTLGTYKKWSHVKVHKEVFKVYLINLYMAKEIEKLETVIEK